MTGHRRWPGTNDFYFFPPLGADAGAALVRLSSLMGFLTNSSNQGATSRGFRGLT